MGNSRDLVSAELTGLDSATLSRPLAVGSQQDSLSRVSCIIKVCCLSCHRTCRYLPFTVHTDRQRKNPTQHSLWAKSANVPSLNRPFRRHVVYDISWDGIALASSLDFQSGFEECSENVIYDPFPFRSDFRRSLVSLCAACLYTIKGPMLETGDILGILVHVCSTRLQIRQKKKEQILLTNARKST